MTGDQQVLDSLDRQAVHVLTDGLDISTYLTREQARDYLLVRCFQRRSATAAVDEPEVAQPRS